MLKNLGPAVNYIHAHIVALAITTLVASVAYAVVVQHKELKISLLPRTPAN